MNLEEFDDDMPMPSLYSVVVGNVGTVYAGSDPDTAMLTFNEYVMISRSLHHRASGEDVTLFRDGDIDEEYFAPQDEDDEDVDFDGEQYFTR